MTMMMRRKKRGYDPGAYLLSVTLVASTANLYLLPAGLYRPWLLLMLNPGLKVPHDILVLQTGHVGDLAPNPPILLIVVLWQPYLLYGVYIAVQFVQSFVHYSESASADFFQLGEIIFIARDIGVPQIMLKYVSNIIESPNRGKKMTSTSQNLNQLWPKVNLLYMSDRPGYCVPKLV